MRANTILYTHSWMHRIASHRARCWAILKSFLIKISSSQIKWKLFFQCYNFFHRNVYLCFSSSHFSYIMCSQQNKTLLCSLHNLFISTMWISYVIISTGRMLFFDSDVTCRVGKVAAAEFDCCRWRSYHFRKFNWIIFSTFIPESTYRLPAAPLNLSSVCHHKLPRPFAPRVWCIATLTPLNAIRAIRRRLKMIKK